MTDREQVATRVRELLAQVLNVPAAGVGPEFSAGATPEWTSLNHLMLISQIESEFGVFFGSAEITALDSYQRIVEAVTTHLHDGR